MKIRKKGKMRKAKTMMKQGVREKEKRWLVFEWGTKGDNHKKLVRISI